MGPLAPVPLPALYEVVLTQRRCGGGDAACRCFPHGGSHQRVNLYACSLSQMVMQEDTEISPGSGKRRPYVQRGREVCIILHLSACTGVNTSVVWSMGVLLRMDVALRVCPLSIPGSFLL